MKLTRNEKNTFFKILSNNSVDPAGFEFVEENEGLTVKSKSEKDWYFQLSTHVTFNGFVRYSVSFFPRPIDNQMLPDEEYASFHNVLTRFDKWAGYLREEIGAVDLWSAIKDESSLNKQNFDSTSQFTPQQILQIQSGIDEIKIKLAALPEIRDNIEIIHRELDSLKDSADKFSRKDWRNLFIGSLMSLLFQNIIPPNIAQTVYMYINTVTTVFLTLAP
ncbi:MAG: hypothetical protein LBV18_00730 [Alistipes sp.]|jgi:hypothetical protein|nr:hypothetical protein [Alistipes sp.]